MQRFFCSFVYTTPTIHFKEHVQSTKWLVAGSQLKARHPSVRAQFVVPMFPTYMEEEKPPLCSSKRGVIRQTCAPFQNGVRKQPLDKSLVSLGLKGLSYDAPTPPPSNLLPPATRCEGLTQVGTVCAFPPNRTINLRACWKLCSNCLITLWSLLHSSPNPTRL